MSKRRAILAVVAVIAIVLALVLIFLQPFTGSKSSTSTKPSTAGSQVNEPTQASSTPASAVPTAEPTPAGPQIWIQKDSASGLSYGWCKVQVEAKLADGLDQNKFSYVWDPMQPTFNRVQTVQVPQKGGLPLTVKAVSNDGGGKSIGPSDQTFGLSCS